MGRAIALIIIYSATKKMKCGLQQDIQAHILYQCQYLEELHKSRSSF